MHSSLLWGVFGPAATLVSHQFTTELESGAQIWRFWFVFSPANLLRTSIAPPVVSSHTLTTQDRWWSWLVCALRWRAIDRFCRLLRLQHPISCVIRVSARNGHNLGGDASHGDPLRVASQPAGPADTASTHGIRQTRRLLSIGFSHRCDPSPGTPFGFLDCVVAKPCSADCSVYHPTDMAVDLAITSCLANYCSVYRPTDRAMNPPRSSCLFWTSSVYRPTDRAMNPHIAALDKRLCSVYRPTDMAMNP